MKEVTLRKIKGNEGKLLMCNNSIAVTKEMHDKLKEISKMSGLTIKEVTNILLNCGLDNLKWE